MRDKIEAKNICLKSCSIQILAFYIDTDTIITKLSFQTVIDINLFRFIIFLVSSFSCYFSLVPLLCIVSELF